MFVEMRIAQNQVFCLRFWTEFMTYSESVAVICCVYTTKIYFSFRVKQPVHYATRTKYAPPYRKLCGAFFKRRGVRAGVHGAERSGGAYGSAAIAAPLLDRKGAGFRQR